MKVSHNLVLLKDQIVGIFEQFIPTAKLRDIDFQLDYMVEKELIIKLDEKIFRGILASMIDNVFKYSYIRSKVTLSVDRWNNHIRFALHGQNLSIKESELDRIFVNSSLSFSDDSRTQGEIGTSLMLALHISKIMEAELSIENISERQFSLCLIWPFEKEDDTKKSDKPDNLNHLSKRNLSHHSKNTVLVVEDQSEMLEYTSEVLGAYYQIIPATNGVEAWQVLKNTNSTIDLVVSDLMMPEMDGFELLEKLRSDEELMTTPVVLLTARKGDENIVKALSVGVSDYITKPFTKEVLLAHCKHLLSNSINRNTPILEDQNKEGLVVNHNDGVKLVDLNWLNEVEKVFFAHMNNKYFNMIVLADELSISERQMRRKLKKITGMSPVQYMNEIKLNNARQMIISEKFTTVSEVSYAVGFETPKYFSILFRERYGVNPSEML